MGMSSSQARLLTLTGRLHSIEYKAQKIEAEKLRLANDSSKAYETYLDALEQTKFVAGKIGEDGSIGYIDLTASAIYDYGVLPKQYSLNVIDNNKALIPASISENYKNTNTLSEFLEAYGLATTFTQNILTDIPNPDYIAQEAAYEAAYQAWENTCANIDLENEQNLEKYNEENLAYTEFLFDHESWLKEKAQYNIDYSEWEAKNPKNVETDQSQIWWVTEDYSMAEEFHAAAKSTSSSNPAENCYDKAINGKDSNCYRHIIAHIIDFDGSTHTKSDQKTTLVQVSTLADPASGWCNKIPVILEDGTVKNSNTIFAEVSAQLDLGIKPNTEGETCDVTASSTDYEKLVSKWNVDGTVKTMKQWAIDLNYVAAKKGAVSGFHTDFYNTLEQFQNELEGSLIKFDQGVYNQKVLEWQAAEPTAPGEEPVWIKPIPTPPTTIPYPTEPIKTITAPPTIKQQTSVDFLSISDKKQAEWYINLWYKMEGSNEPAVIQEIVVHDDVTNTDTLIYTCQDQTKSNTTYSINPDFNTEENENYIVITDDKLNDYVWVKNTIEAGVVIIKEFNKKGNLFDDTSVPTNTNLKEVQDKSILRKAEADFEANMKKIDMKERKYDQDLTKLDAERNAIKSEIDTLKKVVQENVDRTFKLFS